MAPDGGSSTDRQSASAAARTARSREGRREFIGFLLRPSLRIGAAAWICRRSGIRAVSFAPLPPHMSRRSQPEDLDRTDRALVLAVETRDADALARLYDR